MATVQTEKSKRAREMYALYEDGATLEEVGICFSLTRERVRQIFRDAGLATRSVAEASGVPKKYSDAELIDCLRHTSSALRSGLMTTDYAVFARTQRFSNGRPWPTISTHLNRFGSWANALKVAGVQPGVRKVWAKLYSDAELIDCLQGAHRALGGVLAKAVYDKFASERCFTDGRPWPTGQVPSQRFGSWREALHKAGLRSNPPSAAAGQRRFGQADCLDAVRSVAHKLGRAPTSNEYCDLARQSAGALPSLSTVHNRCGTWSEAIRRL